MQENKNDNKIINEQKKPNESVGFYFSSFIKIFDPNNNETILQKRGDD